MIRWCYTHGIKWYAFAHLELKRDGRECSDEPPDEEETDDFDTVR